MAMLVRRTAVRSSRIKEAIETGAARLIVAAGGLLLCMGLSGCLVVSYSAESGWWVWPGSVIVTLAIALIWWLSRRHW
jgi:protein-S-isoprenylcysteine O-methyltransferase Ste14